MMRLLLLLGLLAGMLHAAGETVYVINDSTAFGYLNPTALEFIPHMAQDLYQAPQEIIKKENLPALLVVAASTALFIRYDQEIVDASVRFGRYIGLGQDNKTYNLLPFRKIPFYVPVSVPAALYYIGDGLTEIGVNTGFYLYGGITKDARALRTASELTEGLCAVGIFVQTLKRSTGRETPMRATEPGGVWRFFPSFSEYQSSVPRYDAWPSGHLASAMVTTTVISMNYPEYKFIRPLCYSLMAVCGYQMMNNGVHWMSDYPFALAMGYAIGKTAVNRGRTKLSPRDISAAGRSMKLCYFLSPVTLGREASGFSLGIRF